MLVSFSADGGLRNWVSETWFQKVGVSDNENA
jgi:hypothetical protein